MEEIKGSKSTIWIVLFVLALLVIVAMGMLILKLKDEKNVADSVAELQSSVAELADSTSKTKVDTKAETEIEASEETISNYNANFSTSVSKELGTDNMIYVRLDNYDDKQGNGYVSVNDKNEAHIYLSNLSE